ncbi:hypothetical protein G6F70_003672 [Rhizopus microsporus]|uniref:Uncharacterized protein n=2 Tax=Rhizopus TaxID=4842 RepID=A0A367KEL2_RHIAZ|nr:hypothetical protein G6F71_003665 [Rhizopus microsporus]RCI00282.1 hypothetical protein CU097_011512 [Rhizopus azygosporus]KAG1200859.1 hypothetical protein G6F70_003672 [Rhizopus microsporus]KAG1212700.1 hypothetical protein G6F69_003469 [Rhizopus microsporus]KAG1234764.1 hypothetical protein G6F67_003272 [Rhizopus microsporus]
MSKARTKISARSTRIQRPSHVRQTRQQTNVQETKEEKREETNNKEMKSEFLQEKVLEAEEIAKLRQSSEQLVKFFGQLGDKVKQMADQVESAANSMQNWEHVFNTIKDVGVHSRETSLVKFNINHSSPLRSFDKQL